MNMLYKRYCRWNKKNVLNHVGLFDLFIQNFSAIMSSFAVFSNFDNNVTLFVEFWRNQWTANARKHIFNVRC